RWCALHSTRRGAKAQTQASFRRRVHAGGNTCGPPQVRQKRQYGRTASAQSARAVGDGQKRKRPIIVYHSIFATPLPAFGKRAKTAGSCPGTISRGLDASCFIRSCAFRFDSA